MSYEARLSIGTTFAWPGTTWKTAEYLNSLCQSCGYIHIDPERPDDEADPWIDLALGTLIFASLISAVFLKGLIVKRVAAKRGSSVP